MTDACLHSIMINQLLFDKQFRHLVRMYCRYIRTKNLVVYRIAGIIDKAFNSTNR